MTVFRVHFTDSTAVDVDADHSDEARDVARKRKGGGIITKVKVLKGG